MFYQSNLRTTPHTNEYIEIPTYISNYIVFISTYIFDVLYEFDKYVHSYIKQINKKRQTEIQKLTVFWSYKDCCQTEHVQSNNLFVHTIIMNIPH